MLEVRSNWAHLVGLAAWASKPAYPRQDFVRELFTIRKLDAFAQG
jgi:hypothetical protein